MNLRHGLLGLAFVGSLVVLAAPVVAGSGWLLVAPPEVPGPAEGNTRFTVDAPLDRWRQVQAFDTARECEKGKVEEWSRALKEVEALLPYPPMPKVEATTQIQATPQEEPSRLQSGEEERPRPRKGLMEIIDESIKKLEREEAMLTDEQKQQWASERDKVNAARAPKQQAVNERYRPWKCVLADAVYRGPK